MSKTFQLRIGLAILTLAAAAGAWHKSTEDAMVEAADHFLQSLTPEQSREVQFAFDDPVRERWHFVPDNNYEQVYKRSRPGLVYGHMQAEQRHLADVLLSTGLSEAGFFKAKTIMSLEEVLRLLEGDLTGRRDPYRYHFSIYGKPSSDGMWGWRVEGHHVSLNFSLKGGKLVSTSPTFFGANPHEVLEGPRKGLRALPREEDLGFELLGSLDQKQRSKAIVDTTAYKDVLTGFSVRAELEKQPVGLPVSELNAKQAEILMSLIEEYANNIPSEFAAKRIETAKATPKDKMFFAWAGATERDKGDYYRIQAPSFLIEYDNTQNNANHTHTVWRDYANDFGRDVLALHHRYYDHGLGVAADD
jgi:hypothetical protein